MRLSKLPLVLSLILPITTAAMAQEAYPSRPVRLIHGFAAGGNADTVARIIADEMSRGLGQSVIVETKPGAGGNIASAAAAKSAPDGYSLVLLTGGHTVSAALYKALQFDPVEDYVFISTVTKFPFFIAVRPNTFASLKELVTKAQAKPGGVTFGSAGVGTTQHLTGELLALQSSTRFTHVPYSGGATATTALLRGDIDVLVDTGAALAGQSAAGAIRMIGVSSKERWSRTPEIPTVAETVLPNFDIVSWTGLAVPAGTPAPIVAKLRAELHRALAAPEVQERLRVLDSEPAPSSGEDMRELIKRQIAVWTRVVKEAGIEKR
jgi:tripartite-type tricarboxylate transporter receptor subunit TctC